MKLSYRRFPEKLIRRRAMVGAYNQHGEWGGGHDSGNGNARPCAAANPCR